MKYGMIAEDISDINCLKVLIRRLSAGKNPKFAAKGYKGCSSMLIKGAAQFKVFKNMGCDKYIVCYDADGPKSQALKRQQQVQQKIVKPCGLNHKQVCILIPIQEMEAWILADHQAISKVIKKWDHNKNYPNPELQPNPKELIEKLSRQKSRPLYSHATHNEKVLEHIDLQLVSHKCPSFAALVEFINLD